MKSSEYAAYDATGLAELVAKREISPGELARCAAEVIAARNPKVNAVVELYADRIERLDETTLPAGPFRGVPFLIKDIGGHLDGRKIEFGSRLCEGLTTVSDRRSNSRACSARWRARHGPYTQIPQAMLSGGGAAQSSTSSRSRWNPAQRLAKSCSQK